MGCRSHQSCILLGRMWISSAMGATRTALTCQTSPMVLIIPRDCPVSVFLGLGYCQNLQIQRQSRRHFHRCDRRYNKDGWDQGNQNVYLHTAEHFGALNSYSYFYEPMPEYKKEARITDTSESAKRGGTGLPRKSGGWGGGWRHRPGWIGGSIWGHKYGSLSGKGNGAIHKSQKRSLVLL